MTVSTQCKKPQLPSFKISKANFLLTTRYNLYNVCYSILVVNSCIIDVQICKSQIGCTFRDDPSMFARSILGLGFPQSVQNIQLRERQKFLCMCVYLIVFVSLCLFVCLFVCLFGCVWEREIENKNKIKKMKIK